MSRITWSEWRWDKSYMQKWSHFVERNLIPLSKIKIKWRKFKFQGYPARSQRWFDLNFDWIGESFSTRAPDLYEKFFQRHDETQYKTTFLLLLLLSWSLVRELWPNCEMVMCQPWKGIPLDLGSINNCYVAILIIPALPLSARHPISNRGGATW